VQPCLLGEVIPNALLMTKEQGLLLAVGHKRLRGGYKLETHKREIEVKGMDVLYLTGRGDDVV
jgi:hypothetical protein